MINMGNYVEEVALDEEKLCAKSEDSVHGKIIVFLHMGLPSKQVLISRPYDLKARSLLTNKQIICNS